jgi:hypothetical protein
MRLFQQVFFLFYFSSVSFAQNLPKEMHFSPDGKRLITGGNVSTGLYNESVVDTIDLVFSQPDYWAQLTNNYSSSTPIIASVIYKGVVYDSVGINFKGFTSYSMNNSQKKSFNIALDHVHSGQDINGYHTLNLNCNYDDPTAMHEVLYNHIGRNYVPELKANYLYVKINGAPWAIYANTQQLDGDFLKEWFLSNDGIRWRAIKPNASAGGGGGGGTGGPFGTGFSSLNYLGTDTTAYKTYYTLKSSSVDKPWPYLVNATNALNNMPLTALADSLKYFMDVDKTLWFLAHEIAWADDDSYVFKGGMDYFVYYEPESGLLFPLEFDGNSAFWNQGSTWSPFYRETDARFPLCNKLLKVPEFRQRYLAHLRTILAEYMQPAAVHAQIDSYKSLIDNMVQNEPKRIYTYAQFNTGVTALKTWVTNRHQFLSTNAEVNQAPPVISTVNRYVGGVIDRQPTPVEAVDLKAEISATIGVKAAYLYYSNTLVGNFERIEMFDDGQHQDDAANDGMYGAQIPAHQAGTIVRYYVEARSNNTANTASFAPTGAEHDVYVYTVGLSSVASDIVINEIMAGNTLTVVDELNEYEDWIELYNKSNNLVNLTGHFLTDNIAILDKWDFPAGTALLPGEYLIVWADEDSSQGPLHANFKLAKTGESLFLLNPAFQILDSLTYGPQDSDKGYARRPNGTGNFVTQASTFKANNDMVPSSEPFTGAQIKFYPNPSNSTCRIETSSADQLIMNFEVFDAQGKSVFRQDQMKQQSVEFEVSKLPPGYYIIKVNDGQYSQKLVVMQ